MNHHLILILATVIGSGCVFSPALHAVEPISIFQPSTRILFQGDSITDGDRGRNEDPNHILGHGYVFIIAAQYGAAFADLNLTFINRGISGNKVSDLEKSWQQDTIDLKPDVLSITGMCLWSNYEQVYNRILTDAVTTNPKLRLA